MAPFGMALAMFINICAYHPGDIQQIVGIEVFFLKITIFIFSMFMYTTDYNSLICVQSIENRIVSYFGKCSSNVGFQQIIGHVREIGH